MKQKNFSVQYHNQKTNTPTEHNPYQLQLNKIKIKNKNQRQEQSK